MPEVSSLDFANGLTFQGFTIPALPRAACRRKWNSRRPELRDRRPAGQPHHRELQQDSRHRRHSAAGQAVPDPRSAAQQLRAADPGHAGDRAAHSHGTAAAATGVPRTVHEGHARRGAAHAGDGRYRPGAGDAGAGDRPVRAVAAENAGQRRRRSPPSSWFRSGSGRPSRAIRVLRRSPPRRLRRDPEAPGSDAYLRRRAVYPLTIALAIETKELWEEVQACLQPLAGAGGDRTPGHHGAHAVLRAPGTHAAGRRAARYLAAARPARRPGADRARLAPDAMIIALNASADADTILAALRAGMNEYLFPPLQEHAAQGARKEIRRAQPPPRRQRTGGQSFGVLFRQGRVRRHHAGLPRRGGTRPPGPERAAGRSRPGRGHGLVPPQDQVAVFDSGRL